MPSVDDTVQMNALAVDGNVKPASSRRANQAESGRDSMPGNTIAPGRRLKVLLICHWFPLLNVIGAIRVGHFAKSLHEAGHEVRVLTADTPGDQSLPMSLPTDRVIYVRARRGGELAGSLIRVPRGAAPVATSGAGQQRNAVGRAPASQRWMAELKRHYYALLYFPDPRAPWLRRVTAIGCQLVRQWQPDIILASAPPYSGLIAAQRIARRCGAPWVADLRDLWADNSYYEHPRWRMWIDQLVERYILRSAAGLITVSPIWADMLRRKYKQPVACILNGFVSEDFPENPTGPEPGNVVSILYTGNIYAGYRDPTPLFQAIGLLTPDERQHVAVHFYGPSETDAREFRPPPPPPASPTGSSCTAGCRTGNRCRCSNRRMSCCCCSGTMSRTPATSRQSSSNISEHGVRSC